MGRKYYQVTEDEWVRVVKRGHAFSCCDCRLTHIVDYRTVGTSQEVRYRVDRRATAAARRSFKFTPDDE